MQVRREATTIAQAQSKAFETDPVERLRRPARTPNMVAREKLLAPRRATAPPGKPPTQPARSAGT